jgi:eukaryotic-like serine/threonine-protein kinase
VPDLLRDRLQAALGAAYTIERELGGGGMSRVFLAEDAALGRRVVVKVLSPELAEGLSAERFTREVRLAARLQHPNVVPVLAAGAVQVDGAALPYYTMPYVAGASLRARLAEGPLPVGEVLAILRDVARALACAHAAGAVHRDVKPENVLLTGGAALVADFGVAKAVRAAGGGGTLTQVGLAVGTPAYMAPEQAAGERDVDHRADLYAWGLLGWEALAGRHPFADRTSPLSLIGAQLTQLPARVDTVRPEVPAALAALLARCLAKDPADRPADGDEVLRALDAVALTPAAPRPAAAPEPAALASVASVASVAVLPFANMSASADDAYFADGMTEEIINALTQVDGLRVAARTSCFAFKGKDEDLRAVGGKLGVGHVLEGSVRKAGPRLRITAQLIDVANGYHLWSERYDRELVDVFALQDEIAGAIAARLELSLLDRPGRGAARAGPRSVEAYELLLRGRVLLWQRGRAILDALPCFARAAALDPELVDAHALLGDAHRLVCVYGMAPARETVPAALGALGRALALDPEHAQALTSLANLRSVHDLDIEGCLALADRALAREPLHVQALCERALVVALRSDSSPERLAQALQHLRTARRVDPLNAWAAALESFSLSCVGLREDALHAARQAVALDAHAFTGRWALVWSLSALGRDDEALACAEETLPMSGRNPRLLAEMAAIHARREALGAPAGAVRAILDELRARAAGGYVEPSILGCVCAAAGALDEARAFVARGVAEHDTGWQFSKSPAWAPFKSDPGGAAMLRALGY